MYDCDHDGRQDEVEHSIHKGDARLPPLQGEFAPGVRGHRDLDIVWILFGALPQAIG